MTILNEEENPRKYEFLYPVEFQEMLCRMSIQCVQIIGTVEQKMEALLKIIWKKMYNDGVFNKKDNPFR